MSEKFKVILFAVAAAFIGGTTLTSCGEESTGEFRKVEGNTENAGSDAKKVEAKKALTIEDFDAVKKKRNKTLSSNF